MPDLRAHPPVLAPPLHLRVVEPVTAPQHPRDHAARRIRITVEISDPTTTEEYEDLPDGWDEMSKPEQDEYLRSLAMTYLENQAGCGAAIVDEHGNEVES